MSKRTLPDWQYAHPDGRNERIRELEAENAALKKHIEILEPPKQPGGVFYSRAECKKLGIAVPKGAIGVRIYRGRP